MGQSKKLEPSSLATVGAGFQGVTAYVEERWITLRSAERQRGALMRLYAKDVCGKHGMEDAMA
jgi:hypothetical protein